MGCFRKDFPFRCASGVIKELPRGVASIARILCRVSSFEFEELLVALAARNRNLRTSSAIVEL